MCSQDTHYKHGDQPVEANDKSDLLEEYEHRDHHHGQREEDHANPVKVCEGHTYVRSERTAVTAVKNPKLSCPTHIKLTRSHCNIARTIQAMVTM